ncbi:MAG: hypothetical protein P1P74_02505 [Desulfuromonadales bacterium]|nr:hypothetical protein [Desulfuromonadales bacterium]
MNGQPVANWFAGIPLAGVQGFAGHPRESTLSGNGFFLLNDLHRFHFYGCQLFVFTDHTEQLLHASALSIKTVEQCLVDSLTLALLIRKGCRLVMPRSLLRG